MAALTLLGKLHTQGWIQMPERRRSSPNRHRLAPSPPRVWDMTPVTGCLSALGRVLIEEVSDRAEERAGARSALAGFDDLGYRAPVGESLQHTARDAAGRLVAVITFGAAAWKCAVRDRQIGWSPRQREAGLGKIANLRLFLILPQVQVPHLASHLLGGVARRIARDWEGKYAHRVVVLESFVETGRFQGTRYRAVNWQALGQTSGRSLQDRERTLKVPVKEVVVLPLRADFRREVAR